MSTFKIPITKIVEIKQHSNADALEIAKVYNFDVIVPKNLYKVGDIVVYVPVGSILSDELEALLFPEGSKIKLDKKRIRAIKIRGIVSEGMLIDPEVLPQFQKLPLDNFESLVELDVAETLGITKYVEPVKSTPGLMQVNPNANPYKVKDFKEYTDVEHGKYYDRQALVTGETVVVTNKMHGTAARYGWFKRKPVSFLDKCLNVLGLLPAWQFCWGSRRVQIQAKPDKTHGGFKSEKQGVEFGDVYTKIKNKYHLPKRIPKNYVVYGEIVGWGIQKGYLYNCGKDEHKFYVYDVMKDGKYLDWGDAKKFCEDIGLEMVTEMYVGPYSNDKLMEYLPINPISMEVNEGIVVTPVKDRTSPVMGRVKLKYINLEYLMQNTTEFN